MLATSWALGADLLCALEMVREMAGDVGRWSHYGNYLGVGACDGPGVEAQVLEGVGYFVGHGEGPDMGARDGPGLGAQFGEFIVWCVSAGEGLGLGAKDSPEVGARCKEAFLAYCGRWGRPLCGRYIYSGSKRPSRRGCTMSDR
jgi:hypothetical protein